jgi:TatD DNase family protein
VKLVPLRRILLETDGPYMAPVPHRGQAAHPGHVSTIAQQVADVKGLELDEVLRTVRENTRIVYGI